MTDNLITLDNISLAYGPHILLDHSKLNIAAGERVCLIGRNGAGKSSLLKVVEGVQHPDSGNIWRKPNLRMARLTQELPQNVQATVFEFVADALAETGRSLIAYHALIQNLGAEPTPKQLSELERLQHAIEAQNGWQLDQTIQSILTRLELNPDHKISELSGGWQRRALLAKALVVEPELLLLDEPTNHLDIEAIQWLEDQLINFNGGLLFITHDRSLLQRLATRIIELDRGHLTSWPGDYENFLRRKEEMLHAEGKQNDEFDKKLAREEQWIRQGIKARRTRNEGRVRALKALRATRAERRNIQGKVSFNLNEAAKSGQLVVEAENISHAFVENKYLIKNFSLRIMRGDRIGLVGPNGIGKSTLLNILLGKITPQSGTITQGTNLQVAYFDQLRQTLDLEKTVLDNVAPGCEFIEINGQQRHMISYLQDFLFTPQRARMQVKSLSGGECNRLLLARLFSQPANVIVLDEPTNDLDIETLELLEEILAEYKGTLIVISHDRAFLDNVVTSTLVFEGEGKITEYIGGYQDSYLKKQPDTSKSNDKFSKKIIDSATIDHTIIDRTISDHTTKKISQKKSGNSRKLSYKEQQELASLPKKIETLEAEQQALQLKIADPKFYQGGASSTQGGADAIAETLAKLKAIEEQLEVAYARWAQLEG